MHFNVKYIFKYVLLLLVYRVGSLKGQMIQINIKFEKDNTCKFKEFFKLLQSIGIIIIKSRETKVFI